MTMCTAGQWSRWVPVAVEQVGALTDGGHKWVGGGGQAEPGQAGADRQWWHLSAGSPEAEHRCCQKNRACLVALILWHALSVCSGHLSSGRPSGPAGCPQPHCLTMFMFGVIPQSPALSHPLPTDLLFQGNPCHPALSHPTAAPCLFQPCPSPACLQMWLAQDAPVAIPLTGGALASAGGLQKVPLLGEDDKPGQ